MQNKIKLTIIIITIIIIIYTEGLIFFPHGLDPQSDFH